MAKECKSEKDICPKCSGDHASEECRTADRVCVNCKHASEVLRIPNVAFNHAAFERNCEAYKRVYARLQQQVGYPDVGSRRSQ